ncbi:MAG TPA: glycosyltransferase [Thermoanaerobaculia bacterium]|nr:glycosyltransferase [Thermoanaerobaculia bacterium]
MPSLSGGVGPRGLLHVLEVVGNITLAGGAQRQVLEVCRRLPRERFAVSVVHLQGDGALGPEFEAVGIPVHDHTPTPWDPIGAFRTAALLRRRRFDLVHAHLSRAEIVALAALVLSRRRPPLVVHKHNEDAWWRRWPLSWLHAAISRRAAALVAPSEWVAAFYRAPALRVADPARLRIIPFGRVSAEPPARDEAREAVRATLGLPAAARLAVAAGRLVRQKRHDVLLEAFARLAPSHPDLHLAVAGTGELADELRALAALHRVEGRVHWLGLVADLPTWLAGCDLFVNSSDHEGLPLVLLDAMAARVPIVATAVSGVPDCIADGETGWLAPPGDPAALAEPMREALARPERARSLGEAARRRVDERFAIDRAAERWGELYEEIAIVP